MNWRWTARRLGISAFLLFHLTVVATINMPPSPLRGAMWWPVVHYLVPIGLDQSWGMFAPNPVQNPGVIEVLTVDKDGIRRTFAFPKMTDYTVWQAIPRVRHSKFTSILCDVKNVAHREFAARYAVRQLKIPESAFPVEAEMIAQVEMAPPFGQARDPMKPRVPQTMATYRFPTLAEVTP